MRIGMGYDVHKLVEGRKLILGGVEIPYEKGLLGHSDADVLVHAIMDALLGAAALGDIGKHFPDTDPQYEGISSILLLEHVGKLLEEHMYIIENIDATVIAQRPKLAPYREQMVENIAKALNISKSQVCVKATTEEGLGFTGRGEGISSQAITLLNTVENYMYDENKVRQAVIAENGKVQNITGCAGCAGCAGAGQRMERTESGIRHE
jgi:2-C-methyl-D-erythritol 2,4-cyclodiphosphate synthase